MPPPGVGRRPGRGTPRPADRRAVSPPEGERGGGLAYGPGPVALGVGGAGGTGVALEDADVQLALVHPQQITGRDRAQPLGVVQQPAQPGHMVLQGGLRGGRWRRVPQHVLQGVDGDDPPRFEQQCDEQGSHLAAADGPYAATGATGRTAATGTRGVPGDFGVIRAPGPVQNRRTEQSEPQPVPHRTRPLPFRTVVPGPPHGDLPPPPVRLLVEPLGSC